MNHQNKYPPGFAIRLLKRFIPAAFYESIEGDLFEQYQKNFKDHNKLYADIAFVYNVFRFLRPGILKRNNNIRIPMIRNYLKIAIRNLKKHWTYSMINIGGLSIGLICCAMIAFYLTHELSFDKFHKDPENTYRIMGKYLYTDENFPTLGIHYSDYLLEKSFVGVKNFARFRRSRSQYVSYNSEKYDPGRVLLTDPGTEFFEIFDFKFIAGNPDKALNQPYEAVLTETKASQMFPDSDPIDKLINYDTLELRVTGVIEDLPSNTHLDFQMLVTYPEALDVASGTLTYILFDENTNLNNFLDYVYSIPDAEDYYDKQDEFRMMALPRIHLYSNTTFGLKPPGKIEYLFIFSAIGLIILIISCTNYMNISIAMNTGRHKEIGVRKVIGAAKLSLSFQFLMEALIITFISFFITLLVLQALIPYLEPLVNFSINSRILFSPLFIGLLLGITIISGLIAGSYPAVVLPGISTVRLFKSKSINARSGLTMRKFLIAFQFTLLIGLGTGAWLIHKQLQYIKTKDLGFNHEGILKIKYAWDLGDWNNYTAFKNQLLSRSEIINVTTGMVPGDEDYGMEYKGENSDAIFNDLIIYSTDLDYFETLNIKGLSGNFWKINDNKKSETSVLINQALAKRLGYKQPIGKTITYRPGTPHEKDYIIDGVFKDFHFFSLHKKVAPQAIHAKKDMGSVSQTILVKTNLNNLAGTISFIEETWDKLVPDSPVNLEFMDEDIEEFYKQDEALSNFSLYLSIIAMILAVSGLIGLSSYMTELRIKEIGIRKVLGASVSHILMLLSKEYIMMILIAGIIAGTISYFFIENWLQNFAYQIGIPVWVFPTSALITLLITLGAVGYQSIKAALANPVDSLRYE